MASITVGTSPIDILGSNARRINVSFANESPAAQTIYLENTTKTGLTENNAGYVLKTGQSLNFVLLFDGDDIRLPWSAVASAGGGKLYYKEMSEYRKVS